MQNGIDISMDTSTPGTLALTLQQFSAGVATTLETTSIELPAVAPAASAYPSDAWLASFPQDDCGFTIFPTPAPTNIAYVGTLSGDFASFKPAQAFVAAAMAKSGGSGAVYFRRGQAYAATAIDDNIQLNGPSASEPFIVGCTSDIQNPRPILQKSFGVGGNEYGNTCTQNVVLFGLDFYDPLGDPSVTPTTSGSAYEAALRHECLGRGRARSFHAGRIGIPGVERCVPDSDRSPLHCGSQLRAAVGHLHILHP
jgi:hypothetical protein